MSATSRVHLHDADCPQALSALAGALTARRHDPVGLHGIGYEPTEHGASVDWDDLEHSWLSSTERAAIVVARGIAMAEYQGGWAPQLHHVLLGALARTGTGETLK
jgi:hypothetical protein